MSDEERTHGRCIQCREEFDMDVDHVTYGGGLWCTEYCLAKWVVEQQDRPNLRPDIDKVAREFEHRGGE